MNDKDFKLKKTISGPHLKKILVDDGSGRTKHWITFEFTTIELIKTGTENAFSVFFRLFKQLKLNKKIQFFSKQLKNFNYIEDLFAPFHWYLKAAFFL